MRRVPQPQVDPDARPTERHAFWPAGAVALVGILLGLVASTRNTGLPTSAGPPATEVQLMAAFAHNGLEHPRPEPPPNPAVIQDPAAFALAMERWLRGQADAAELGWRVNPAAKDPCPT